ncbi:proline-specific peptidase [Hypoxylon sp. NC0597]|nr:proline-specific peptidase [Hypoxylon sp. NC0597]
MYLLYRSDLQSSAVPLILIHGGPGACHEYLLSLADLALNRPLVFYDQIGNGRSTHLPEKAGDEGFWTIELFKSELDNSLSHLRLHDRPINMYGHSWGSILAAEWASTPESSKNLRRLVVPNSLASIDAWRIGVTALRAQLPADVQEVLDRYEEKKDFESPEYEAAVEAFCKRYLRLARPWPSPEDSTTYGTMYGPSELYISGSLRDWTCIPSLRKIQAPTLPINGVQDEAQDVAMQPFFDHIQKVKWDQRKAYMRHLESFLAG